MKWHTKNRLLAFLLVFVFAFGLAACNDNAGTADSTTTTPAATTPRGYGRHGYSRHGSGRSRQRG